MTQTSEEKGKGHYLRGIIWLFGGNVISVLSGMVLSIFSSRMLSQEELGAFFLNLMLSQLAIVAGTIGLRVTVVKFLGPQSAEEKMLTSNIMLTMFFLLMIAVCLVLSVIIPFLTKLWPGECFESIVWYVIPWVALEMFYTAGVGILVGYQLFKLLSIVTGLCGLLRTALSIVFLFLGAKAHGMMWGGILAFIVLNIFMVIKFPFHIKPYFIRQRALDMLRFGLWIYGADLSGVATFKADTAILATYINVAQVAVYNNASRLPNLLMTLFDSMRPVVLSYVSSDTSDMDNALIMSTRVLSGFLSIASAAIMVLAQPLVVLLFSEKYLESVPILRIMGVYVVLNILNYYLSIYLIGDNKVQQIFYKGLLAFVFVITGHLILIPSYGGIGAAISITFVAFFLVMTSSIMLFRHKMKSLIHLFDAIARSVIPLVVLLLVIELFNPTIVINVVLFFAFVASLLLVRSVTSKDLKVLYQNTLHKAT